jgi:hypothetical protein
MLRTRQPRPRRHAQPPRHSHHDATPGPGDGSRPHPHRPGLQQRLREQHRRPAWDRWDARSQAVISRADYIRRHAECSPGPQPPAHVESAVPGPHGAWLVRYEIGGIQFTDHWFYVNRRWVFDLILSNPAAAQQYRLPFAQYAAAIGCNTH